jgi:hypothetical protein
VSLYDTLYNAFTGDVSPGQVASLTQQEQASLVQAGADPATASSLASADVTSALSTFSGAGGLGLSWTGALPGQSFGTALESKFASAIQSIEANWYWYLGGIIALGALYVWVYGGFRVGR